MQADQEKTEDLRHTDDQTTAQQRGRATCTGPILKESKKKRSGWK
jgi:hypothetical protein